MTAASPDTRDSARGWHPNRHRKYARAEWVKDEQMLEAIVHETRGAAENGTVVDLGCGLGNVAARFAEVAERCVAVDHDAEMLRQASPVDRVEYVHARVEDFAGPRADVVVARNVVHYVGLDALCAKAAELLREDGVFLVCQAVPPSGRTRAWHDALHDMMDVARAPSTDDLVSGLRSHAFRSIRASFHFHRMNVTRWLDARVDSPDLKDKLRRHHDELADYPEYEREQHGDELLVTVRFAIVTGLRG